ncbi:carboxymuconolactone decarboxylase family protein [Amycolatopsis sp. PS_44_ISF1]|uniref:carboxymuconolactone decarboxylase family protein n=1 Tax=Amycolatopsis sp. PS_44_ISF1 TaxID=2974917 RepID=UPI0028DF7189|nr:carboxymuconolactone decarboxylase family protein [Amycolatopsis sp. PS_44_ISF1]MDT8915882.1 carboxymuconolactone decarboxylase family protein [Amycolatopsis sp. PS_44_ISF1]
MTEEERYELGVRTMDAIGDGSAQRVLDSLGDVAPDLARQIVSWGFGEVYSRPGLVPRDRQLLTIGMLTALGGCEPQLEVHIGTALNVGLTPAEIVEALLQSAGYCGFPKALNATLVAKKVFGERGLLPVGGA